MEDVTFVGQVTNDLQKLAQDNVFQTQLSEQTFEIALTNSSPEFWQIQYDLLVVLKLIFDRSKPKRATVIIPNLVVRHPTQRTKVLLQLMRIESIDHGLQTWINYLVEHGKVAPCGLNWWSAFEQTRTGFQIKIIDDDKSHDTTEMNKVMQRAFGALLSTDAACKVAFRDVIRQTATSLLLDPLPLAFAIKNYWRLMKTSYDTGASIETIDIALQAIHEGLKQLASRSDSKVKIIVVTNTLPQSHIHSLFTTREQYESFIQRFLGLQIRDQHSYRVSFVSLPNSGSTNVWRHLVSSGSGINPFCKHFELPTYPFCMEEALVRSLLHSSRG